VRSNVCNWSKSIHNRCLICSAALKTQNRTVIIGRVNEPLKKVWMTSSSRNKKKKKRVFFRIISMTSISFIHGHTQVNTCLNLGRVYNSRGGCVHATHLFCSIGKLTSLEWKTRPKQHYGFLRFLWLFILISFNLMVLLSRQDWDWNIKFRPKTSPALIGNKLDGFQQE
jgi:hypothetical protein